MREHAAVFYVTEEAFQMVCEHGNAKIPYLKAKNYHADLSKFDFVIIRKYMDICAGRLNFGVPASGGQENPEVLRLFIQEQQQRLAVISCFGKTSGDISLQVISFLCYQSILNLRYTNKDLEDFSMDRVEYNMRLLSACLDLLDGSSSVSDFIAWLADLEKVMEDFYYPSAGAILKIYGWKCPCEDFKKKVIYDMQVSLANMQKYFEVTGEWEKIWREAYAIHNKPEELV